MDRIYTPDSHHASETHMRFAKVYHIQILNMYGIIDAFLDRQLFEYNQRHDIYRLTTEYTVPHLGTLIIGTKSKVFNETESYNTFIRASVREPEGGSYKFIHDTQFILPEGGKLADVKVLCKLEDKQKLKKSEILARYYRRTGFCATVRYPVASVIAA